MLQQTLISALSFQKELILAIIPFFFSCCPLKVLYFSAQTFSSSPSTSQPILLLLQEINFGYCSHEISDAIFLIPWTWPSCSLPSPGLSRSGIQCIFQGIAIFLRGIFSMKSFGTKNCGVLVTSLKNQRKKK